MNKLSKAFAKYIRKRQNLSSEYSLLIISSHGIIDLDPDNCYTTPIKLKKINAASIGCPNYMSEENSNKFIEDISEYINTKEEKKIRTSKNMIKDIQKKMCDLTNSIILDFNEPLDNDQKLFVENKKYHNKVCKAKKGDELLGKCFVKYIDQNYDTLILFHNGEKIVLDHFYNSHDDEMKYICMLELLEKIKDNFQIEKLIITDFTCSNTLDNDEKFCKQMRTYLDYFFNIMYGGKTFKKRTKKKRTNKRKRKKTSKTMRKRNKTHKIKNKKK